MSARKITGFIALLTTTLTLASAPSAQAQDWKLTLSPYLWMTSLDGDMTVKGNKRPVDASFKDIWDDSDSILAFNSEIELHNGTFGFYLAPSYADLGVDDVRDGGLLEADVSFKMFFIDAAGMYRVADWPMHSTTTDGEDTKFTLDVLAGVRYTKLETEIDFDNAGSPDADKDWFDLILGLESHIDLLPNLELYLHGDFGGFGLESSLTANGIAALVYKFPIFGHPFGLRAGYRTLFQDYDDGSGTSNDRFEWDITTHGPILGIVTYWG